MHIPKITITDLFDNKLEVTDIDAAITQAEGGVGVEVNVSPFVIVNGISHDIEGREHELVSMSDYWQDVLKKLYLIKTN